MRLRSAALIALALGAGAASAEDKTFELKLSHWVPPTHPLQKAIEDWGADVEKASGGTIKYKVFPSQQLGKAFDHYDMARDGIADFTYVNPGYQPGRFPIIAAGELPFLIGDVAWRHSRHRRWYRKYAATEMKDVHYCFSFILDPLTWHSKTKKIVVPGDIKGMKIRPSQATVAAWVTLLGGTNVQASATEVRDVMEKGVAEAVNFPWGSVPLLGVDKVTKYHMDAPINTVTFQWLMNPQDLCCHVAGAEKGDRRSLHDRMGRQVSPIPGRTSSMPASRRSGPNRATRSTRSPTSSSASGRNRRSRCSRNGPDAVRDAGGDPDTIMKELKAVARAIQSGLLMPIGHHACSRRTSGRN